MRESSSIDAVLAEMQAQSRSRGAPRISEDHQFEAVRRFWDSHSIPSFRDAYLLSWGLCLPHRPSGPCILDDLPRLRAVLDGVDGWSSRPNAYRRCYQGLLKSYFTYDVFGDSLHANARNNWGLLREYLKDRNAKISDGQSNPKWVETAVGNKQLFGDDPCQPYVDVLLTGDASAIDHLCEQLGISESSWFLRELVLAQVRKATKLDDVRFEALIPRLLDLLSNNLILRDRGLILILDRYAKVTGHALHQHLRDLSVLWWGNPWLPSNETRWGGVTPQARAMVSEWLKLEFIETFFTKLAEDGMGDPRRMNFWKRYVKAIGHIEFALGAAARDSEEADFVALRRKMKGLICNIGEGSRENNAFVMTMGNLVAVEFSGMGNAFYAYDARAARPFDTSEALRLRVDAPNSLKNTAGLGRLRHKDNSNGWDRWEDMFEAVLRKHFSLEPQAILPPAAPPSRVQPPPVAAPAPPVAAAATAAPPPLSAAWQAALNATQAYSPAALARFAAQHGFQTDDKTSRGGNVWVYAGPHEAAAADLLTRWGFQYKANKGWWK